MPVIEAGGSPSPTVSIGTSESPRRERAVAAAADVVASGEVDELPARCRRDEHLARVRVAERTLDAGAPVRVAVEQRRGPRRRGCGRPPRRPRGRAATSTDGSPSSASREPARVVAVEHRRAVRGGDERAGHVEPRGLLDRRLAVVGAEDDRVAREERVGAAGGLEQRGDRGVGPAERLVRGVGAEGVRGVVVVREVVDEQVEAVARDEPAADRRRVGVDRAERAVEKGDRRAGLVGLVEAVVEEPLRPVHGREAGDRREVPVPAAVGRDVDRRRRQARRPRAPRTSSRRSSADGARSGSRPSRARPGRARRRAGPRTTTRTRRGAPPRGSTRRGAGCRARRRGRRSRSRRGRRASATGRSRRRGGSCRARAGSGAPAHRSPRASTA